MSTVAELDAELNRMIAEGQGIEAFEQFYADNVVMMENDVATEGKAANRARHQEFFGMIKEIHGMGEVSSAVNGNITFRESWFEASFKGGGRIKLEQVAVRRWADGQIVHERFYYKAVM